MALSTLKRLKKLEADVLTLADGVRTLAAQNMHLKDEIEALKKKLEGDDT